MKFTKKELKNIKRLVDSVKAKDYSDLARLTDEMFKIAKEIYYLRNQYVDLQTEFNKLKVKTFKEKVSEGNGPEDLVELKAALKRKQELDRMAGF